MTRHVRKLAATDPRFGCAPAERCPTELVRMGALLLDKACGPTSRAAADAVRRLLGAQKVGHGGTLDPKVTGVLPVLLDHATRAAGVFLGSDKTYAGSMQLHGDVADDALAQAVRALTGDVEQMPPRRSRVKRQLRRRTVHEFAITGRDGRQAAFVVRCAGGTYIRKLVHDLGVALGCGAHMASLRRTQSGAFAIDECVTQQQVEEAAGRAGSGEPDALRHVVAPVEDLLVRMLPTVVADDGAVHAVCAGQPLAVPGVCGLDDFAAGARVAVVSLKGEAVGLGRALMGTAQVLAEGRGLAVRVRPVLMQPDTYPRRQPGT